MLHISLNVPVRGLEHFRIMGGPRFEANTKYYMLYMTYFIYHYIYIIVIIIISIRVPYASDDLGLEQDPESGGNGAVGPYHAKRI